MQNSLAGAYSAPVANALIDQIVPVAAAPVARRDFAVAPFAMPAPGQASVGMPGSGFRELDTRDPTARMALRAGVGQTVDDTARLYRLATEAAGWGGTMAAGRGIRAFHGSPHDFDRFDMSRIGTGEGAQAYGHGLYFAENEGVAKSYREMLARPSIPSEQMAAFRARDPQIAALYERNLQEFGDPLRAYHATENAMPYSTTTHAQRELVYDMRTAARDAPRTGRMYEVNLRVDPNRLLDWDAPLSQQPPAVRDALGQIDQPYRPAAFPMREVVRTNEIAQTAPNLQWMLRDEPYSWNPSGGDIVQDFSRMGSRAPADAANLLREAGIPGIRYLDGGSRGAGAGTRNYVIFDDALIEILRKYGLAGLGIGLGAGAATQAEAAPQ